MVRGRFGALLCLSSTVLAASSTEQLCGQYQNDITRNGYYSINPNQWGEDGSGAECVLFDPTATPDTNGTAFTTTWSWSNHEYDVHSFPNAALLSHQLPAQLNNTNALNVDISWTMGMGNTAASSTSDAQLLAAGVKANVAFDCFLDPNMTLAGNATLAGYEFMVWLAAYGGEIPVGYATTLNPVNYTINGQSYSLYSGANTRGQQVFSFFPAQGQSIGNFSMDLGVLLHNLTAQGSIPADAYLGSIAFGTEATHSPKNVTFAANTVRMVLDVKNPRSAASIGAASSTTLLLLALCSCVYWFGIL